MLPQLAKNGGWLKLMGEARTEQRKRQHSKTLPESDAAKAHKARRQSAQRIARSKRRGYFGLARAIASA